MSMQATASLTWSGLDHSTGKHRCQFLYSRIALDASCFIH